MEQGKRKSPDAENGVKIKTHTISELHEKRNKELEKQLQVLSKLSEKENLSVRERLDISTEIRQICMML